VHQVPGKKKKKRKVIKDTTACQLECQLPALPLLSLPSA
jgi:hypothetical protein